MAVAETSGADYDDVRDWFARWGALVAAVDFTPARALFDEGVVAFGTHQDTMSGLDNLEQQQWRAVWPTIEDFAFNLDTLNVLVSPDRLQATAVLTWHSTGIAEDGGHRFERPGRTTAVLRRDAPGEPWCCVHTHFSLNPGTPPRSYGHRQPAS